MIPNTKDRELTSSGVAASGAFGISLKDQAHVMTILRDTLYSDKILAVLREYSANAWDAHRMVGKGDVPIKVTIPTVKDPTLTIRDFGPGLSQSDVFEVFTQYGASTKRSTDTAVGMLGIGSKSGFAYSETFTVTSWHGGTKRVFIAALDPSDVGIINLLHEEPCGEETGVEIKIAVKSEDVSIFAAKARTLFKYFEPRPEINIPLPEIEEAHRLKAGMLFKYNRGDDEWVAVMGCVPYRLNLKQVSDYKTKEGEALGDFVNGLSGVVFFDIGEVQINASREELKYGDRTKDAIVRRINLLVEEFVHNTLVSIEGDSISEWDKRLKAQILRSMRLPVPAKSKDLVAHSVTVADHKSFKLLSQGRYPTSTISVNSGAGLFLKDTNRSIAGYRFYGDEYVLEPAEGFELKDVEAELPSFLANSKIVGIPVHNLSTRQWLDPKPIKGRGGPKVVNEKHHATVFKLKDRTYFGPPWSGNWEIEKRDPTANDVYVIINGFKAVGMDKDFFYTYEHDKALLKRLGIEMPPVYGYKTTEKKPLKKEDLLGLSYSEWRHQFFKEVASRPRIQYLSEILDMTGFEELRYRKINLVKLVKTLGKDHVLFYFFRKQAAAWKIRKKLQSSRALESVTTLKRYIEEAAKDLSLPPSEDKGEFDKLLNYARERYPLLKLNRIGIVSIIDRDQELSNAVLDYIQLVDRSEQQEIP